jgi:kynurenine formamidase
VVLISRGERANIHRITTLTHISTHFDAPWHFNDAGLRVTDLDASWFVYQHPLLIDVPKPDEELIVPEDLDQFFSAMSGIDMLMLRTGFGECRATDPERYGHRNPAFDPSVAEWLMQFPELRALAIDTPSALCPAHRPEGLEFHRRMLGRRAEDRFILLVEDVRLEPTLRQADLERGIVLAPLLLDRLDGAPATVLAL